MNWLAKDCIAIDTNVFSDITNRTKNTNNHINTLLRTLMDEGAHLLVDSDNVIVNEYNRHLLKEDFLKKYVDSDEVYLLVYWMKEAPYQKIAVNDDELLAAIKKVIHEKNEHTDRILVYIAFIRGKVLISNDKRHITGEQRRADLLNSTTGIRAEGGNVMTSEQAYAVITSNGG